MRGIREKTRADPCRTHGAFRDSGARLPISVGDVPRHLASRLVAGGIRPALRIRGGTGAEGIRGSFPKLSREPAHLRVVSVPAPHSMTRMSVVRRHRESTHWKSPHGRALPAPGGRTLIMGILNVTPDSFSDGGRYDTVESAVARACQLVSDGADVLDLGAESTRPGAPAVSSEEEIARLLPALRAIRAKLPDVAISIDTYKADVAETMIRAGADIINDVHGGRQGAWMEGLDSPMCRVAAATGAPIILMHNRESTAYADFLPDFRRELQQSLAMAMKAGVPASQIWIDPGFGFGKTPEHNLIVTRTLTELVALGYPVLFAASNKSTLGKILEREDPNDRHEGNVAAHLWAIQAGAAMIRLHEPAKLAAYLKVTDAIRGFAR